MLKELRIFNIILIESAEIFFEKGLNVITGETGSGKSAILHALSLVTGARADSSIIRKGKEKGAVEAYFEEVNSSELCQFLERAGITCESSDFIIRREIFANGKSRAYINNQLVQVALLKTVGEFLIDIVNQHASRHLLSTGSHRRIIDMYGGLENDAMQFANSWNQEIELKNQVDHLINQASARLREIEHAQHELQELEEAALKEEEDETLFTEFSLLANAEEIAEKSGSLLQALNGERQSMLQQLHRQKNLFDELASLDSSLHPLQEAFAAAYLELQEIAYSLSTYHSRIENNPARYDQLNKRLTLISQLKRKYGSSIPEIQNYQKGLVEKLNTLNHYDAEIGTLQNKLKEISESNEKKAKSLTCKRQEAALSFTSALVKELVALNMLKVQFQVEITPQKRSRFGDDSIEFFLIPNIGEHKIPLKECASGGEISRVLLALHVILAGKEKIPTLFFDEIDEGIGGTTAGLVGKKLKEIGTNHQILCITHFPQVARQADLHFQISKAEKEGRTETNIQVLNELTRHHELARMVGG